jgi:hypothetical protein
MDKTLLKAYIRTIVEEEIKRALPQILGEAISEIKQLKEHTISIPQSTTQTSPPIDRARLAEMMGISYDGETLSAMGRATPGVSPNRVSPTQGPPEVVKAINRDYSELMKAMKLT